MQTKPFYLSRLIWLAILEITIGILFQVAEFIRTSNFSVEAIILLVAGALTFVLRWYTDQPIGIPVK